MLADLVDEALAPRWLPLTDEARIRDPVAALLFERLHVHRELVVETLTQFDAWLSLDDAKLEFDDPLAIVDRR